MGGIVEAGQKYNLVTKMRVCVEVPSSIGAKEPRMPVLDNLGSNAFIVEFNRPRDCLEKIVD